MNKRILIVDDEPDIRLTLKMLLTSRGYEVDEAEDGRGALERIKTRAYGLMILDIMMPRVSGWEVMKRAPAGFIEATPTVLLTAKAEDKDIMDGYARGATYYITKPFSNSRILDIATYLLGDVAQARKEELELKL